MGGLLDFLQTPQGQGLLSGVIGYAANARRGTPINNLGRGGLSALAGYSGAIDRQQQEQENAFQRQFRELQMGKIQSEMERQKAEQAWRAGLPQALQAGQTRYGAGDEGPTMAPGDPNAVRQYLMRPESPFAEKLLEQTIFPKAPDYKEVGGALLRIGPDGVTPVYQTPKEIDYNKPLIPDGKGGMMVNDAYVDAQSRIRAAGKPVTNIDVRNIETQESEQSKIYGRGLGEIRTQIQTAGFQAPQNIARIERMTELLQGVEGGALAPTALQIANVAQSMGLNIDPKLGDKQAAEALAVEMALAMRTPGTGPMTDKDFDNFAKAVPSLAKTAEGRAQISNTLLAKAQRDMRIAQMARDYAARNGGVINDQFFDEVAAYIAANPVTPQAKKTQGGWSIRPKGQ